MTYPVRSPSRSTRLPYTTLFRSQARLGQGHRPVQRLLEAGHGRQAGVVVDAGEGLALVEGLAVAVEAAVVVRGEGGDRKSTRLNSSHVAISYAVFCLKKKRTTGV